MILKRYIIREERNDFTIGEIVTMLYIAITTVMTLFLWDSIERPANLLIHTTRHRSFYVPLLWSSSYLPMQNHLALAHTAIPLTTCILVSGNVHLCQMSHILRSHIRQCRLDSVWLPTIYRIQQKRNLTLLVRSLQHGLLQLLLHDGSSSALLPSAQISRLRTIHVHLPCIILCLLPLVRTHACSRSILLLQGNRLRGSSFGYLS